MVDQDDRALLGRQGRWAPGWFSTLAGFVESGESAEAAVRREVLEEAGIVIADGPDDIRYLGSQPWPFPCSLMLGYHARAAGPPVGSSSDGTESRSRGTGPVPSLRPADYSATCQVASPWSSVCAQ